MKERVKERVKEIVSGWYKFVIQDPVTEKEAKRRIEICAGCPLNIKHPITRLWSCKECGCPTVAMSRSKDKKCKHPEGSKW